METRPKVTLNRLQKSLRLHQSRHLRLLDPQNQRRQISKEPKKGDEFQNNIRKKPKSDDLTESYQKPPDKVKPPTPTPAPPPTKTNEPKKEG